MIFSSFFSAVMDGIDLDIEGGGYKYYPEFITELRMLMDNDQTKNYLITGAPQCPYPDHHLGPEKPGSGKISVLIYHMGSVSFVLTGDQI